MRELAASIRSLLNQVSTRTLVAYLVIALVLALSEGLGFLILIPLLLQESPLFHQAMPEVTGAVNTTAIGLLIFFVLFTVRSLLMNHQRKMTFLLETSIVDPLRLRLLASVQDTEWEKLSERKQGDLLELFNTLLDRFAAAIQLVMGLLVAFLTFAVYALLLIWSSPAISIAAIALLAPLMLLAIWRSRQILRIGHALTDQSKVLQHRLHESLSLLRVSRRRLLKDWQLNLLDQAQTEIRQSQAGFVSIQGRLQLLFQTLGSALLCAYLYIALVVWNTPPVELSLVVFGFARLYPLLTRIQQMTQGLKFVSPSVHALKNEQGWLNQHREKIDEPAGGLAIPEEYPDISFENVELAVAKDDHLHTLVVSDLTLPARTFCCIVGPSGQGKSTFLDLLAGVSSCQKGHIRLSGMPDSHDARAFLRESSRYISQDNPLIYGSVRDNLLIGNPPVTEADMEKCLRQVNGDFVFEWPDGLETQVGERGQQLSGGQRQRLLLANALLGKPRLLILDEATSALDRESEEIIQKTLANLAKTCTVISVSHRLGSLKHAHMFVEVNHGRVSLCSVERARSFCV